MISVGSTIGFYLPANNRGKQVGDVNENYAIVDGHKFLLLLVLGVE